MQKRAAITNWPTCPKCNARFYRNAQSDDCNRLCRDCRSSVDGEIPEPMGLRLAVGFAMRDNDFEPDEIPGAAAYHGLTDQVE